MSEMRVAMIAFTQRIEMAKHLVKIAHCIGMLGLCGLAAGQMERVGRDDPLPLDQPHALIGAGPAAAPGKVERTEIGRSEGRRVGKECVSTGRSRWAPDP